MTEEQLRIKRSNERLAKLNKKNAAEMKKHVKGRPVKPTIIKAEDIDFGDMR